LAEFCNLFTRDPASGILLTYNSVALNLAQQKMRGVDLDFRYATSLGSLGDRLALSLNWSRLLRYDIVSFPGSAVFKAKGGGFYPQDRATLRATYDSGNFNLALTQRYIGSIYRIVGTKFDQNRVDPEFYTDAQVRYKLDKAHSLYAGVNNLFDKDPPFYPAPYFGSSQGVNTAATLYDIIGRFFYAGISTKF
jgi:outer membrane receptor protein involved in Fe transport